MNAISMNNLWTYLSGLSMSAQNKRWLSDKLIESARTNNTTKNADNALRELDGCWASDNDAEEMASAILNMRREKPRNVETLDD